MQNSNQPIHYLHVTSSHYEENHGSVIVETPVSLTVNGELWSLELEEVTAVA